MKVRAEVLRTGDFSLKMGQCDQAEGSEDTERASAYEEGPADRRGVGARAKVAAPDHERDNEHALQHRVVPVERAPEMEKRDNHEQPQRQCPSCALAAEKPAAENELKKAAG